jgi:acetolactate synthase I/II/III large subunit
VKYSDQLVKWLLEEGYTHCFFVAGGNIMHLLDSVRNTMTCVPFVNEVGAAIAAEYFTEASSNTERKAFVLVTAGPGLTNTITALASAWVESRELLVIGGQVKSTDLANGEVRQRGIQEVDGIAATLPFTKSRLRIAEPTEKDLVLTTIRAGASGRKGPVFLEITLDAQGAPALAEGVSAPIAGLAHPIQVSQIQVDQVSSLLKAATRPVILIGSGVSRAGAKKLRSQLEHLGSPVMLTWNAADRYPEDFELNFGRPNIWGQRYSNVLIQQSDLVIAVGTRLGMQQTGFSWEQFVPNGKVVQVDLDLSELMKSHPRKHLTVQADAEMFLLKLVAAIKDPLGVGDWLSFCREVKSLLPTSEKVNKPNYGYINPFDLMLEISEVAEAGDFVIPASSGASFTVAMQTFRVKNKQTVITNKGLASMGYGLSGSIGASIFGRDSRTWLFEGDGGFAQNLQELGTVAAQKLNLKMFIMANNGYASIRMTQRNYFNGSWIGCDTATGLGLANLEALASAYSIDFVRLSESKEERHMQLLEIKDGTGPVLVEVPIDPEQSYFPKISSVALPNGSMRSNPLHLMDPELPLNVKESVFRYLGNEGALRE